MCGGGLEGPRSALVDAEPWASWGLGPGNTNVAVGGWGWVVPTRYTHPPSTHPVYHPPGTQLTAVLTTRTQCTRQLF